MAAAVVKVFDTQTLMVPVELTTRCQSVALDMGGSVLKVVYKTKGDLDDAISKCNKYGRLHVVSFERSELERGLDYVRQHAYLPSDGDQLPTMYATGAGCHEFVKHICQKLNIRIGIRAEFDCFVKSFVYMAARLPRTQLLEPFLDDAVDEPLAYVTRHVTTLVECQAKEATRGINKLTETLNQQLRMSTGRPAALETALVGSMSVDVPLTDEEPDLFPCVLVTCGSGTAVMKIEKDGSFKIVDVSSRGGRSFFGIGKLLSGCKTFDELIDLASKGNSRNIDVYSDELFNSRDAAEDDSSSVYDMLNKSIPSLMYSFGKATVDEQTSFSREDIAAAWLNYVTLDLVECLHSLCNMLGVRRVFFCGGFCSSATVRRIITAELARRNMFKWAMSNQAVGAVVFDFIKPGQYLGALGCLLTGIDN